MTKPVTRDISFLETLPPEWQKNLLPSIKKEVARSPYKIVVLDDDPTGTQTVSNIPVLTHWTVRALANELLGPYQVFFVLTNSRSLSGKDACTLAGEIGANLRQASGETGVRTVLISRSDSTLRGHFPAEVDAMAAAMGKENLPYLVLPFFLEGGRYTIGDIHYVRERDRLIPAAETPFARDAVFGFTHSDLKEWVEEKTGGRIAATEVISVSLEDIRHGGPGRVAGILDGVGAGQACIVNAASYGDMEVLVSALLEVENRGKEFLYRTAASFVRTRAGLDPSVELLAADDLVSNNDHGGLFIIGSYVAKTSLQVAALLEENDIRAIEADVHFLLDPELRKGETGRIAKEISVSLREGRDTVLYTSRTLIVGSDVVANLAIGRAVSDSLVEIARSVSVQPRYLVAKGGITSSDIATGGLGVRRAMVLGQVLPGVPAWRLGPEARYPGMTYIVFPGNVGDADALVRIRKNLHK